MKHSLSDTRELIKNRRTIKPEDFKPRKVLDDQIKEILNSARWAPTHGKTEPWHFVIFQEEALKELGEFMANTYKNSVSDDEFMQRKNPTSFSCDNSTTVFAIIIRENFVSEITLF